MLAQAVAEAPLECCGLLAGPIGAGRPKRRHGCYPLVNASPARIEFESDAAEHVSTP